MKFNSQICTSRLQSERLLALGLKKETADCGHCSYGGTYIVPNYPNIHNWGNDTPAWSLHRLMEICKKQKVVFNLDIYDSPYDEVIAHIQSLIHLGYIDEGYLDMDIVNKREEKNLELQKNGGEIR